ncbi:glycosyltransferase [Sphingomonas sp. SUN019]|uniref:glycosyltransferase n=1 Tax=Sphingomonas sp. SUN019 TaxID=2937788 RepID=UPI002164C6CC|nr:glycosyltransferase [Sphingomonas sp. SUN019]UVO50114.1 glycosyltransferase [Sphingomonas sp. SUN019]
MSDRRFCVCVPARNEAARLPILLDALAAQTLPGPIAVALCINNSDDDSVAVVAEVSARHAPRLDVRIDECALALDVAHVGTARRRAMDAGLMLVEGRGVLLSTDADCRPPSDWIAANLAAIAEGADIVGGRIVLDDAEPIAPDVVAMRARYDRYWAAVRAIEDAIDPSPHDPPPRHGDHTGASLAIDAVLYQAAGGVPAIACGEDRALVIAAVAAGGRLAHPMAVWTRVSARTVGRAAGGMAMAMAQLSDTIAHGEVPRVTGFDHWRRRATWRRDERARTGVAAMLAREERLPSMPADIELPR